MTYDERIRLNVRSFTVLVNGVYLKADPEPSTDPIPWWAASALTVAVVALSSMFASASVVLRTLVGGDLHDARRAVSGDPLALGLSQAAAFALMIFVTVRLFSLNRSLREALGCRVGLSTKGAALLVVMGFGLQFPFAELSNVAQRFWPTPLIEQTRVLELLTARSFSEALAVTIAIVVIAPVAEELFFRGALFEGLRVRYGAAFAICFTAALFGVSHGSVVAAIYATLAGLVFGVLRLRTGSVFPSVVLHASINAVPVLLSPAVVQLPGFNVASAEPLRLPWWVLVSASLAAVLASVAFVRFALPDAELNADR